MDSPFYYLVRNQSKGHAPFTSFLTAYDAAVYAEVGQAIGVVPGMSDRPSEGTEGVDYVVYATRYQRR